MREDDDVTQWSGSARPAHLDHLDHDDNATVWVEPPSSSPLIPDDSVTIWNPGPSTTPAEADTAPPTQVRADKRPRIGTKIAHGRYELVEELQSGNQAWAFKARDLASGGLVFLKLLRTSMESDADEQHMAISKSLLQLQHRNLMRCLDIGLDNGRLYEASELLAGEPMDQWIKRSQPLDHAQIQSIVAQLSAGIHALHTQGKLAHRDIKPANILVLAKSDPFLLKIVDYGVACSIEHAGVTSIKGTRSYWPPEFFGSRYIRNDEAHSADWWGLGRIVQELVDGHSVPERIRLLTTDDKLTPAQRNSLEWHLDELMSGRGLKRWGVRAGMVDKMEGSTQAERWLRLLHGLLTTTREDRWGYDEVRRSLAGERVDEHYSKSIEVEGFPFRGESWKLSDLARHLISQSAKQTSDLFAQEARDTPDAWSEARDLARKGDLIRYAKDVLADADLPNELQRINEVPDRDLGTALALARLAEAKEPPLLKHAVVNRNLALSLAGRNDSRAHQALQVLLSRAYRELHSQVHAPSAAELNELVNNMAELRNRLQALQVQSAHPLTERLLLQQLAWPESQRLEAIEALRAKLSHTTHEPLQQLYQQPSAKLATVDQHCLLLALQAAAKNSFITYEAQAVHLQRRGRILRTAAALERCTLLYKWWSKLLEREGRFWLLLSGLGIAFLLASGVLHRGPGGIGLINAAIWLLPAAGFWYCRRHFVSLLRKDIQAHDPGMAAYSPWSVLLLRNRTREWASNGGAVEISPLKELKEVNRQIAALRGITPSNYTVQLASLKRANAALYGVAALLLLAWTQSNILPGFRLPQRFGFSGQPSSRRPLAPGTVPIPWRGQTIVCWINNANAVSGSNGQPRSQAHRTLIYNRPIVIEWHRP